MPLDLDNRDRSHLFDAMRDPEEWFDIKFALRLLGVEVDGNDAAKVEQLRGLIYFLQRMQLRAEERADYYAKRAAYKARREQEKTNG
jgi:hypothetical protein